MAKDKDLIDEYVKPEKANANAVVMGRKYNKKKITYVPGTKNLAKVYSHESIVVLGIIDTKIHREVLFGKVMRVVEKHKDYDIIKLWCGSMKWRDIICRSLPTRKQAQMVKKGQYLMVLADCLNYRDEDIGEKSDYWKTKMLRMYFALALFPSYVPKVVDIMSNEEDEKDYEEDINDYLADIEMVEKDAENDFAEKDYNDFLTIFEKK